VFGWFGSEQRQRRRKVRRDRKHLEERSRLFLNNYLEADETRKSQFYRAVEGAAAQCHPAEASLRSPELEDAQIAEATSTAAMKVVLDGAGLNQNDPTADFINDAYATVAIAYHRAAGIYTGDKDMLELGTAAVHLLTMATSYMGAQTKESVSQ
jgi:hypothetical protein